MISSSLPELEKLRLDPARSSDYRNYHLDAKIGAEFMLGKRRRLCELIESFHFSDSSRDERAALKWVKIYVGGERMILTTSTKTELIR